MYRKLIAGVLIASSVFVLRRFVWTKRCRCTLSLQHKTIVVTGPTSGIGLALVQQLARLGATVILASRDLPAAHQIREDLILSTGNAHIEVEPLDLQSFASIEAFAHRFAEHSRSIYALVNNAGIFYAPPYMTADQLDGTFQTNYAGPFLLTLLLLPSLRRNRPQARIINLSSRAHLQADPNQIHFDDLFLPFEDTPANRFRAYQNSKFFSVLFARRLCDLLARTVVSVHCVDPGNVETAIYRTFPPLANPLWFALQAPVRFFAISTPLEGAQGVLHALRAPDRPFYVHRGTQATEEYHPRVNDPRVVDQLWLMTRNLCADYLLEM